VYASSKLGHLDVVKLLVDHGADVDREQEDAETPLFVAAKEGRLEVLQVLVGAGALLEKANHLEETAAFAAAEWGHVDVLRFLLASGADIRRADSHGRTLALAAAAEGSLDVLRLLADNLDHAALHRPDEEGNTPVLEAADMETLRFLYDHGADLSRATNYGTTPAHSSTAQADDGEMMRYLGARGAALDDVDEDGDSPLILAAAEGSAQVIRYLASQGCSLSRKNKEDESALDVAEMNGNDDVAQLLCMVETAGGWSKYVASNRMPYVRIRHEISRTHTVLEEGHDDRELLHFLFGRNKAELPPPPPRAKNLYDTMVEDDLGSYKPFVFGQAANKVAVDDEAAENKQPVMFVLPDAVFALVVCWLV